MPEIVSFIGAVIRWILKGCKTKFREEINGIYNASWGGTYDTENYIIGLVFIVLLVLLVVTIFFR